MLMFVSMLVALAMIAVPTPVASGKLIVVDLGAQTLYAYEGAEKVMEMKVSTGRPGLATPTGEFKVTEKLRHNRALPELGGGSIPFTLRVPMFDPKQKKVRRIAIHQYHDTPARPASNGCIRVRKGDAEKLFNWAEIGTPVHVVDEEPLCLL
jgi:lipoprotein-anchoring transpeptidase ErfK/SrfK